MSGLLSKLARVSDNASWPDALAVWIVVAFLLGIMFCAQIAAIAVMVARAG